jgi:histidyl-tRNA synthetase
MIRSVKGTHDILPDKSVLWRKVESTLHDFMLKYGYGEIRTPIFEKTELFKRSVGEDTDIVSKEMYSWIDQGGENLTLKPELTAPVVRAFIQNNLGDQATINRIYYKDACFRRERPQKGRTRQFHQFGTELFGSPHPEADVEIISLAYNFYRELGLKDLSLKINSIGSEECRTNFRNELRNFLKPLLSHLTETSKTRFEKNPLRILDTKVDHEKELLKDAPKINEFLTVEDQTHFKSIISMLGKIDVPFEIDPQMVRGLDYYTRTTFEITTPVIGSQDALCGGGRYDNLVESLGGKPTPAIGFGAGVERLILAIENIEANDANTPIQIYVIGLSEKSISYSQLITKKLREEGFTATSDLLRRSLKSNLREANRLGAKIALIIGDDELDNNSLLIKNMVTSQQQEINAEKLIDYLSNLDL